MYSLYDIKIEISHIYFGIGGALLYISMFYFYKKVEPAFIFQEKTRETRKRDIMGLVFLMFFIVLITVLVLLKAFNVM